ELSGSPIEQHVANRILGNAEQRREERQVRCRGDDRADVEIAVRPAVEPAADAGSELIVHGAVAQRTSDTDRLEAAGIVEEAAHADDRVERQERQRHGGIAQIDTSAPQGLHELRRERIDVDLQAQPEGRLRADARADAAVIASGDRLVQPQRAAPEIFVAEIVEAEDLAAALQRVEDVLPVNVVEAFRRSVRRLRFDGRRDESACTDRDQGTLDVSASHGLLSLNVARSDGASREAWTEGSTENTTEAA